MGINQWPIDLPDSIILKFASTKQDSETNYEKKRHAKPLWCYLCITTHLNWSCPLDNLSEELLKGAILLPISQPIDNGRTLEHLDAINHQQQQMVLFPNWWVPPTGALLMSRSFDWRVLPVSNAGAQYSTSAWYPNTTWFSNGSTSSFTRTYGQNEKAVQIQYPPENTPRRWKQLAISLTKIFAVGSTGRCSFPVSWKQGCPP